METRRIACGDVVLAVAESGAGGRPLLLVHGHVGAKEDFTPWLDRLAERGWHAVAPDLRGHGDSDKPAGESAYSLALVAADLAALAGALGWEHFTLLGHSMGGMACQLLALDQPDRLDALVLMGSSHGPPDGVEVGGVELGAEIVRQGGIALLNQITAASGSPLDTAAGQALAARDPAYAAYGQHKSDVTSGDAWIGLARDLADPAGDRLERLHDLRVPTLVLVGDQDRAFLAPSQRLAEAIPGARLVVLPGGGHSTQFEVPDAWWSALTAFLDQLPLAATTQEDRR